MSNASDKPVYRQPVQVLVYAYRLVAGVPYWLLLKRSPERGSFWQGVTGAIEPDEPLTQAALRELCEETSLRPVSIRQTELVYDITLKPEWVTKYNYDPTISKIKEFVFLTRLSDDAQPILSHEHIEFVWRPLAEALPMLKWPKNAEALAIVDEIVRQQCTPNGE